MGRVRPARRRLPCHHHRHAEAPSASAGGTIAFEVDDLPAVVADLKAKGVEFAAEGIESPVCHMAIVKDPDGNAIILHKLKREM